VAASINPSAQGHVPVAVIAAALETGVVATAQVTQEVAVAANVQFPQEA